MSRCTSHAGASRDRTNFYDDITSKIISELQQGRVPWVQPWGSATTKAQLALPKNASTNRTYSGINVLILWGAVIQQGFSGQSWLTFRQTLALGGHVRKGAGYGNDTAFRDGLTEMELPYIVGVQSSIAVWAPGTAPLPARPWSGRGRETKLLRRDECTKPVKASDLALSLPRKTWKTVRWREGSKGELVSRFARLRVRPSHRDYWRAEPRPEE
jgi:hypothetical protein